MSSLLGYIYEFARKKWIDNFIDAKSHHDIVEKPDRFRDFPVVHPENCISCGSCTTACPSPQAIKLLRDVDDEKYDGIAYPVINKGACIRCGFCAEVCPTEPKSLTCGENHLIKEDFTILPTEFIYVVDDFLCIKCKKCFPVCPVNAISEVDNKIEIDQSKCISCNKCYEICPVQGAIRSIHLQDVEDQKKVINYIVSELESFIESHELEIRDLQSDKIIKKKIPVKGIFEGALELLDDKELVRKILEHQVERLQLRIILWHSDECEKCQSCIKECPVGAISFDEEEDNVVRNPEKCLRCSICYQTCPFGVITYFLAKFELIFVDDEEFINVTIKAFPLN